MTAITLGLALTQATGLLDHAVQAWRSTPEMAIEDAYKWLFQAALGGEHAIEGDEGARAWLEQEWKSLSASFAAEALVVKLTPDGAVIRVNLRPYKASGGDREMLLAVFVESARAFKGDKARFIAEWTALGDRLSRGAIGRLRRRDWVRLSARMHGLGYPAVHHSRRYETAYRPAYRVVLGGLWLSPSNPRVVHGARPSLPPDRPG